MMFLEAPDHSAPLPDTIRPPRGAPGDGELARFRRAQRLAFECAARVQAEAREGMTERELAARLGALLAEAGVRHLFHAPMAWIGDRTELGDGWAEADFMATDRRLAAGVPVILDVAPIVDGFVADAALTFALGPCPELDATLEDLALLRALLPRALRAGLTLADTYALVGDLLAERGYAPRHARYPLGILGHRVARLAPGAGDASFSGAFGPAALRFLRGEGGPSPLWNGSAACVRRPEPGLWAVEPHLGRAGVGAKLEELLVVTEDDAYWLDEGDQAIGRSAGQGISRSGDQHNLTP